MRRRYVASSESLTRGGLQAEASAAAIIHCHSTTLWTGLRGVFPTTYPDAEKRNAGDGARSEAIVRRNRRENEKVFS